MVGRALAIAAFVAVSGIAWATTASGSPEATSRIVPCRDIIDDPPFPYRSGGYRLVLGAVSVPAKYLKQVVPTSGEPWPYWRKAGLVVRAGAPTITVSVPRKWRRRVAITWGNGSGAVSSLTFASCRGPASTGHAYAGGFYLRTHAACAPLIFRVGARRTVVRFGLGVRC